MRRITPNQLCLVRSDTRHCTTGCKIDNELLVETTALSGETPDMFFQSFWQRQRLLAIFKKASVVILFVLLLALGLWFFNERKGNIQRQVEETRPGVAQAPPPKLVLPPGRQTYYVQSSEQKAVRIKEVVFDPLDTKAEQVQKVSVKFESSKPVRGFVAQFTTDNKTQEFPLFLVNGTNLDGTTAGSWAFNDTHEERFSAKFKALTDDEDFVLDFPIR